MRPLKEQMDEVMRAEVEAEAAQRGAEEAEQDII